MERNDQQQLLLERRSKLMSLDNHPGWQELVAEINRRKERDTRALLNRALAGEDFEDLKSKIDYLRGWEAALQWVVAVPGGAEAALERFLSKERQQA